MSGRSRTFTVAAVQMRSSGDRERNLAIAERLGSEAARRGASLVAFPENVAYIRPEGRAAPPAEPLDGPTAGRFAAMARRHGVWVLAGTIAERAPRRGKIFNTSVLYAPDGGVAAIYRKMHLFDVSIPGRVVLRESTFVQPGDAPTVAATPLAKFGLSICYDLRFPELYRRLAMNGATVLLVPSAFTAHTGRSHWTTLLRARAIENLAWVIAPAQWGTHHPGRRSYGHTSVIDPWGRVVVCKPSGSGVVVARIDLDEVERMRRELPVLDHVRKDLLP